MARKPRFYLPGSPVHAVQRGRNKTAIFIDDFDRLEYLRSLKQAADDCGCAVHAYVLMTNHVHLLLTPEQQTSVARMFQNLGRHYVRYFNSTHGRYKGLWEGRYKSNIIQSEIYLLTCQRYIEMGPVRAGIADHPAKYRWSSYAANALGVSNPVVTGQEEYMVLGHTPADRQSVYRNLFDSPVGFVELELLELALQSGTPLGNEEFNSQIEALSGRKIGFFNRGRPPTPQENRSAAEKQVSESTEVLLRQ